MKTLLTLFVLLFSVNVYSQSTVEEIELEVNDDLGNLLAMIEGERGNLYLSCTCIKGYNLKLSTGEFYMSGCNQLSAYMTVKFELSLLYALDLDGNKIYYSAINSSLENSGNPYPFKFEVSPDTDIKIAFDFIIPDPVIFKFTEIDYFKLYRLSINKYTLDFEIIKYLGEIHEKDNIYNFDKNSNDYYLNKIFKNMKDEQQWKIEGSCKIIEKKL